MKKFILAILVASFAPIACSQPPENNTDSPPSNADVNTLPEGSKEPADRDPFTPEERARIEKRKACQANPEGEGCACVLNSSSLDCKCSKDEYANSSECRCHKNPNDAGCVCATDPNGLDCFCSKNPNAEKCRPQVDDLCRRYCFSPEAERSNSLTEKLRKADCDHDDLLNEFEIENGLDPCNADTNGNGILDTNDTYDSGDNAGDLDGDGVPDEVEERLQLEKENPFTSFNGVFGYKDRIELRKVDHRYGTSDGDLWIIDACDKYIKQLDSSRPQVHHSHKAADLKVMLPNDSLGKFFPLPSNEQETRDAAMLFSSPGQGIFGGLIAKGVDSKKPPTDYLSQLVTERRGLNFSNPIVGANKKTHDQFDYAQAEIKVGSLGSRGNLQKLLFENISRLLAGSSSTTWLNSFTGLTGALKSGDFVPKSDAAKGYALKVTVLYRTHRDKQGKYLFSTASADAAQKDQVIFLYAFAPIAKGGGAAEFSVADDLVATRLRDLTNTTSITQLANEIKPICVEKRAEPSRMPVYFYFVIDESESMRSSNAALASITQTFFSKVSNTELTFKAGVTNLSTDGSLNPVDYKGTRGLKPSRRGVVARWTDSAQEFEADVAVLRNGSGAGLEYGFSSARIGLEAMRSSRTDNSPQGWYLPSKDHAKVITIFMSDEPDNDYAASSNKSAFISAQIETLRNQDSKAFAIVKEPTQENFGYCYQQVALATGGAYAPLTTDSSAYLGTLDAIIDEALSSTSNNVLPQPPISSSLQVFKDYSYGGYKATNPQEDNDPEEMVHRRGQFVPRSLKNGYSYSTERNVISFTGSYKPVPPKEGKRGEDFIVLYYFYDYKTKAF